MRDVTDLILFWNRECGGFSPGKPRVWKAAVGTETQAAHWLSTMKDPKLQA